MPLVTASFNINRPGLEREVVLQLDPECFSQRIMLDCFRSGRFDVVHYAGQMHYDGAKDEECILEIVGMGPAN